MDDDDWYGPDFVADLLLARDYSGAEIVGMPAEYLYLEPLDVTVRRNDASENWGRFVAGGTMMLDRALLREVGGFRPVHRFVDASLLGDVLGAGGRVYRTQGLGYLFRRTDAGHTWQADLDFFLDPARLRERWDGFHPSRLLETRAARCTRRLMLARPPRRSGSPVEVRAQRASRPGPSAAADAPRGPAGGAPGLRGPARCGRRAAPAGVRRR